MERPTSLPTMQAETSITATVRTSATAKPTMICLSRWVKSAASRPPVRATARKIQANIRATAMSNTVSHLFFIFIPPNAADFPANCYLSHHFVGRGLDPADPVPVFGLVR